MSTFSVDTKLFRELGSLLVGRESTALIELIKNAYDADATEVTIIGKELATPDAGSILVADNGIGMGEEEFSGGFLRIAGRSKTSADRRSPWFQRRYTGEKGIGRLAAHKLAHRLSVTSRRWNRVDRDPIEGFSADSEISARIDWDMIEALETLSDIEGSGAVRLQSTTNAGRRAGTQLVLAPLRKRWTEVDLRRFQDEVSTLTPPAVLTEPLSQAVINQPFLFEQLRIRDDLRGGDFTVNFSGDLSLAETDLPAPAESADWVIEIDCNRNTRRLRIAIAPTLRTLIKYSGAERFLLHRSLDDDDPHIGFQARILQREGVWPTRYQGVRVYYEGFRVLPPRRGAHMRAPSREILALT